MSLCQITVEALLVKRWRPQDCNNLKLVSDKLKSLKNIYEKDKADLIGIIQRQLYRNRLSLLKGKTTAREI